MSQQIVIYGAGGLGREIAVMIEQINAQKRQWQIIGFCDDGIEENTIIDGLPVIGNGTHLNTFPTPLCVALAIANPIVRKKIVEKISNKNISFPRLIHPGANLGSSNNKIGPGSIITAGCVLTTNVRLEKFTFVNLCTTIGHDVTIGAYSAIMPGVHISGGVTIGECTLIGSGAVILQGITIGANATVGAGAVVTRNVADKNVVIGIPARKK